MLADRRVADADLDRLRTLEAEFASLLRSAATRSWVAAAYQSQSAGISPEAGGPLPGELVRGSVIGRELESLVRDLPDDALRALGRETRTA
jgi:hypothetical protein